MKKIIINLLVIVVVLGVTSCNQGKPVDGEEDEHIDLEEKESKPFFDGLTGDGEFSDIKYNDSKDVYAYIDAVGFETIGNVYLIDNKTGNTRKMTDYKYGTDDTTVKRIHWFNDHKLLMIVGYGYGTVTVGGSLNVMDINSGIMTELLIPESNQEIMDIVKTVNGGLITLVVAQWDDTQMNFETFTVDYTWQEMWEMIELGESQPLIHRN